MAETDRDALLSLLLGELKHRRFAIRWASAQQPYNALVNECPIIASDERIKFDLRSFLKANPIIQQSVKTLVAWQAMVSNIRWQDVPMLQQQLARRGWHLSRWLPTFLLVDAPTGLVLTGPTSPLGRFLQPESLRFPALTAARVAFSDPFFRSVRNAVAHWSFTWTDADSQSYLTLHDAGTAPVRVALLEAEALHLIAHTVIPTLEEELFERINPMRDGV